MIREPLLKYFLWLAAELHVTKIKQAFDQFFVYVLIFDRTQAESFIRESRSI